MDQDVTELQTLFADVTKKMHGLDDVLRLCLVALCADGHVLLEGNPGLGKTTLVKTLAKHLGLDWGRIQFTPDLMPTDITGTDLPIFTDGNQTRFEMKFQRGPIFTSLLLADEINRASPKTQSAMLEAMAERQVTVQGKTHSMTDEGQVTVEKVAYRLRDPFMVLATQNPLDYEGTYELPKAQADRFMMKLFVHLPGKKHLLEIMAQDAAPQVPAPVQATGQADDEIRRARRAMMNRLRVKLRRQESALEVIDHIATIVLASNGRLANEAVDDRGQSRRNKELDEKGRSLFEYGFSPRAATALRLAAQGWVYLWPMLNPGVEKADGASLAAVLLPVLRHRTVLKDAPYGGGPAETNDIIDARLINFCQECAAGRTPAYRAVFDKAIGQPK